MTYTANVPNPSQSLGITQPLINSNFQRIAAVFAINHVDFNSVGEGKHKFVQMPEQSAAPATLVNEGALYTKDVSGSNQLFYRKESNGTQVQFTSFDPTLSDNGTSYIPGGLIFKWGKIDNPPKTGSVIFPVAFPNDCFQVQLSCRTDPGGIQGFWLDSDNPTPTSIKFYYTGSSGSLSRLYWLAIGY